MVRQTFFGVLIWFPVVLLPFGNILAALLCAWSLEWRLWILSLVGAVAEEVFFRWLLLKRVLLSRVRPIISVILVSFLFSACHLLNLAHSTLLTVLVQLFAAFCFSVWAGAVVWKTERIAIPLIAHLLVNATAVAECAWISLPASAIVLADGALLLRAAYRELLPKNEKGDCNDD